MTNHIHLAWQQGSAELSAAVQNFAFRYAQRINRYRKEVGHVFQGRFKSILVNMEIASESRVRELTHVRAVIALLARDKGLSIVEVAKKLNRDSGGLSRLLNKLHANMKNSSVLMQEVASVKNDFASSIKNV